MSYFPVSVIDVMCWGRKVGALAFDPSSGYYAFEYYPEFQRSGIELAPLTLPSSTLRPVVFTALPERTYYRLPAFVADSLPDAFGNALIDAWMADQGVSRDEVTVLDRLAYMGKRGMGALEFQPAAVVDGQVPSALEMRSLVEASRRALAVNPAGEATLESRRELDQLISVGSSAGGARAKAVVGWNPDTGEFVSGQFDVPEGFEHWILKFDLDRPGVPPRQYGRIEYAYYLMARECGITMSESRLQEAAGGFHFMTRRFDRLDGEKAHMQTLCAMGELDFNQTGTFSSAQLFEVVQRLGLGYGAVDEVFMRLAFDVCLANNDDHTKNWSFLLREGGDWELAPAYDLTYAFSSRSAWTAQHFLSVNGKFRDIDRDDLLAVAERFNVSDPQDRIDKVVDVASRWPEFAKKAGISESRAGEVAAGIDQCCGLVR